jgi:hypothetical protein
LQEENDYMKAEYENIVRMYEVNEAALIDAKL